MDSIINTAEKLHHLMQTSIIAHGFDPEACENFFRLSIEREPDREELMWALLHQYFSRAFRDLFIKVKNEMVAGGFVPGSAEVPMPKGLSVVAEPGTDVDSKGACATPSEGGEGVAILTMPQGHSTDAAPKPRVRVPQNPSKKILDGFEARATKRVVAMLFNFRRVYNIPLNLVTRGQARNWLRSNKIDCKFVELLIAPMTDDGMVIGDWYKDEEEVKRIYLIASSHSDSTAA